MEFHEIISQKKGRAVAVANHRPFVMEEFEGTIHEIPLIMYASSKPFTVDDFAALDMEDRNIYYYIEPRWNQRTVQIAIGNKQEH